MLETLIQLGLGVAAIVTATPLDGLLWSLTGVEDCAEVATRA